jgi:hypothetical protein
MGWTSKGIGGPPLSMLCSFYKEIVSMVLWRVKIASISRWVIIAREGFSRLGVLSSLPPLSLVNMLHMIGGGLVLNGSFSSL